MLYILTDLLCGNIYKDYSFNEQAVSELFAIGAPTSHIVVPLFTASSILMLFFALGIYFSSDKNKILKILSFMIAANAIDSIILWNYFPMNMRGVPRAFTDKMHGILAVNPFILLSIILGIFIYKNWFRYYSIIVILILLIPAFISFSSITLFIENKPTPWMGITERIAQYDHMTWHAILAIVLIKQNNTIEWKETHKIEEN